MNSTDSLLQQRIIDILKAEYPEQFISLQSVPYQGDISLFTLWFDNEAGLEKEWDKISGMIAAYYQASLTDQFTKWNIYVCYLCKTLISISLKYKIENDRFSSRKIILDNFSETINDLTLDHIIRTHITNKDLNFSADVSKARNAASTYDSSGIAWDLLKKVTLKPGKGNLKDTQDVLEQIEAKLTDENKKS
ncbi:hypothetical protein JN11_00672 [Mucilaginibacter frigoritolerans]|uniref:Uncharacterized protein n=1 Tax=Mucilaginibacter frigoritolerans TaxID=652788 RepID=A0A562UGL7_9SPHI|nr:ABC-three component system middle component 1 [Mucilaginibacter frigoritolerans]TWJ04948.1 hypothetical protein JN11_00672 [Mucilaginibacter frigoritolerans]